MSELVATISRVYGPGDSLLLQHTVVDSNGDAVDITGWTLRFGLARTRGGTVLVGTELSPATATASITNDTGGVFTIAIAKTVSDDLTGDYYFKTEGQDGSGYVSTLAHGWQTFPVTLTLT